LQPTDYLQKKKWTTKLLIITTTILIVSFIGLLIHANTGGIYEQKTIKAMLSRITITGAFSIISWYLITKKNKTMKKYLAISTVILMGFTYSCNNSVKEQNSETSQTQQLDAPKENAHQHSESDSIEFNNGAKWKVVPDMMKHIRNMESDINRFAETKHSDLKDYTQLGASLQKNIDLLTSNCTMEGKAHDELHKWLVPLY
jgi:hypothetical protein